MIDFDLSGLEGYTLTDRRPALQSGHTYHVLPNRRGKARQVAVCPDCGRALLDFIQDHRVALWCYKCGWVWLTRQRETNEVLSHRELIGQIVAVDEIEARRGEEAA